MAATSTPKSTGKSAGESLIGKQAETLFHVSKND